MDFLDGVICEYVVTDDSRFRACVPELVIRNGRTRVRFYNERTRMRARMRAWLMGRWM